jgi:hypothetical protein
VYATSPAKYAAAMTMPFSFSRLVSCQSRIAKNIPQSLRLGLWLYDKSETFRYRRVSKTSSMMDIGRVEKIFREYREY